MTSSPQHRLNVQYQALEADAKVWDNVGTELGNAQKGVDGIKLGNFDFSFLGDDVKSEYEGLRSLITQLNQQGQAEANNAASALRSSRRIFQGTEDQSGMTIEEALAILERMTRN